jgi:hypothetical protein
MAKTNTKAKTPAPKTHEGGKAKRITKEQELTRSVMACFLWEDTFYEEGTSIVDRIRELCTQVSAKFIADTAIKARHDMKLRHMPLFLLVQLLKKEKEEGLIVRDVISKVISRVDEMGELLSLYALENNVSPKDLKKLDNQLKKGLAQSFKKFDQYQFGKYKGGEITTVDVIRLVHPKAENEEQNELYRRIAKKELAIPDTWETALSAGGDKKEVFTKLLSEEKLGGLALLRNLRNMSGSGVDRSLVLKNLSNERLFSRVLPFRFLTAEKHAPEYSAELDKAMLNRINEMKSLGGTTAVIVDCSGSMQAKVSEKSVVSRKEAAAALGALIPGDVRMYAFGETVKEVPARKGLAGIAEIENASVGHATNIPAAVALANKNGYDRIIVITDEQMQNMYGAIPKPLTDKAYFINVAVYQHGVGYGDWTNISGFSENTIKYIAATEGNDEVLAQELADA